MSRAEADRVLDQLSRGDKTESHDLVTIEYLLNNILHWAAKLGRRGDTLRFWAAQNLFPVQTYLRNRKVKLNLFFGHKTYRWKGNPEERRFAEAWAELTWKGSDARGIHFVDRLIAEDPNASYISPASAAERRAAATVIQWLGSPVGQSFLRELGYERRDPDE